MKKFKDININNHYVINELSDLVIASGVALEAVRMSNLRNDALAALRGGILTELANRLSKEGK